MTRQTSIVFATLLLILAASASAQLDRAAGEGGTAPLPELSTRAAVLYDQLDFAAGNGSPDQDFEADFDAYDSEAADDFLVDFPAGWSIQQINTVGTTGTPGSSTVSVDFYTDNGGTPLGGTVVCSYAGIVPVDSSGSLTIDLPTPCDLDAGLHWVAIQVAQEFGTAGQHFWSNRTAQSFAPAKWRNPGDGFVTGCTDWADQQGLADGDPSTGCGVGGGVNPDFLFQLVGELNDGLTLSFTGEACPDFFQVDVSGAAPDSTVAILGSSNATPSTISSGVCAGTEIAISDLEFNRRVVADGTGSFSSLEFVSSDRCGLTYQAIDLATCETSAVTTP